MKSKILLALGLAVVIFGVYKFATRQSSDTGETTELNQVEADRNTLESEDATDEATYEALHRLAHEQDKDALISALQKATDESRMVREGAANALGYFKDDNAFQALRALLDDAEVNVRIRTLQALSNANESRRTELVKDFLKREGRTDRENTIAHSVLLKMLPQDTERTGSLNFLISFVKGGDDLERFIAFSKLLEAAPNDKSVVELARLKVRSTKNIDMKELGQRHLDTLKGD